MLEKMLKIINRDKLISRAGLAAELKMPEEMIDDGIYQLLRMGYLIEDETSQDCATFCSSCNFASNCSKEILKTFKLSEKGSNFLKEKGLAF